MRKCAILLSVCGPDTYATIRSIVDAETLTSTSYEDLIKRLQRHYDPKPSFIVQRFKFYNRTRAAGETVSTFVAALRQIAEHCEYRETLKDMIRDRLVCRINHEGIQKKLLAEKNLTYERALEIALALESAEQGTKDLKSAATAATSLPKDLHYAALHPPNHQAIGGNKRDSMSTPCYRCLGNHTPSTCKFCTAECHFCKKIGHIAKACRSKKDHTGQKFTRPQRHSNKTHHLAEEEEVIEEPKEQDSSYHLFTLESNGQNPITVQVELNQVLTEMEVDTGSSLSLINKSTYDSIASKNHIQPLQKSKVKLKTYTGELVGILGTAKVEVTRGEVKHNLVIHVVDGKGPNLMGRDWLSSLVRKPGHNHTCTTFKLGSSSSASNETGWHHKIMW